MIRSVIKLSLMLVIGVAVGAVGIYIVMIPDTGKPAHIPDPVTGDASAAAPLQVQFAQTDQSRRVASRRTKDRPIEKGSGTRTGIWPHPRRFAQRDLHV